MVSAKAKAVAAYLAKERDQPDFQLRIANALVSYGNDRLEDAAKLHLHHAFKHTKHAKYTYSGPANHAAVIEASNRDWAAAIRGLSEGYIRDLREPRTFKQRLRKVRRGK